MRITRNVNTKKLPTWARRGNFSLAEIEAVPRRMGAGRPSGAAPCKSRLILAKSHSWAVWSFCFVFPLGKIIEAKAAVPTNSQH
jgi:hypothetical protein